MNPAAILLSTVLVPTLGAVLLPFVGLVSPRTRNLVSALLVLATVAQAAVLVATTLDGTVVSTDLFGMRVSADPLASFMAATSSLVSFVILIYSFGYIAHYEHQNEYFALVVLFLGSMMGLVFSQNLLLIFTFWELTSLASYRLIGFFRKSEYVAKAGKAFLVTVFGALLMLIGFVALGDAAHSFDLADIVQHFRGAPVPSWIFFLILGGLLSKSATLPFHTWLPDAGVAPSPVTALLHAAVLVKIGVYVFARMFVGALAYDALAETVLLVLISASALVSAGAALVDTNIKRVIAFSTISQLAFVFLGFVAGNGVGVSGALLFILVHGISKAGLFLGAGVVEHATHTKDIEAMGGLGRTMPVTAASFFVCALSVMGLPPFGGFFGKLMVITGAVQAGHKLVAAVFVVGAVLTVLYLLRLFNRVFLGEPRGEVAPEGDRWMVGSVATLAVASVLSGLFINWPSLVAEVAAQRMLSGATASEAPAPRSALGGRVLDGRRLDGRRLDGRQLGGQQ